MVFEERVVRTISRCDFSFVLVMSQIFFSFKWQTLTQTGWGEKGIPWLLYRKVQRIHGWPGCIFSNSDPAKPPLFTCLLLFPYVGVMFPLFPYVGSLFGWHQEPRVHVLWAWHSYIKKMTSHSVRVKGLKIHSGRTWVICLPHTFQRGDWYQQHLNHIECKSPQRKLRHWVQKTRAWVLDRET